MRKLVIQLMALVAVATLSVGTAYAKKGKETSKDNSLTGSITAVDKGARTITIHAGKGDKTVAVDETTIITKDGLAATFDDLKTGVTAVVGTFATGDKLTAVSVKIGTTPVAAAEKTKKKKKDK